MRIKNTSKAAANAVETKAVNSRFLTLMFLSFFLMLKYSKK